MKDYTNEYGTKGTSATNHYGYKVEQKMSTYRPKVERKKRKYVDAFKKTAQGMLGEGLKEASASIPLGVVGSTISDRLLKSRKK